MKDINQFVKLLEIGIIPSCFPFFDKEKTKKQLASFIFNDITNRDFFIRKDINQEANKPTNKKISEKLDEPFSDCEFERNATFFTKTPNYLPSFLWCMKLVATMEMMVYGLRTNFGIYYKAYKTVYEDENNQNLSVKEKNAKAEKIIIDFVSKLKNVLEQLKEVWPSISRLDFNNDLARACANFINYVQENGLKFNSYYSFDVWKRSKSNIVNYAQSFYTKMYNGIIAEGKDNNIFDVLNTYLQEPFIVAHFLACLEVQSNNFTNHITNAVLAKNEEDYVKYALNYGWIFENNKNLREDLGRNFKDANNVFICLKDSNLIDIAKVVKNGTKFFKEIEMEEEPEQKQEEDDFLYANLDYVVVNNAWFTYTIADIEQQYRSLKARETNTDLFKFPTARIFYNNKSDIVLADTLSYGINASVQNEFYSSIINGVSFNVNDVLKEKEDDDWYYSDERFAKALNSKNFIDANYLKNRNFNLDAPGYLQDTTNKDVFLQIDFNNSASLLDLHKNYMAVYKTNLTGKINFLFKESWFENSLKIASKKIKPYLQELETLNKVEKNSFRR